MTKKLLFTLISITIFAIVFVGCSITPNNSVNIDATGYWLHKNDPPVEITLSISGMIQDNTDNYDELDLDIVLPSTFQYMFTSQDSNYISMNQKYDDFPHLMICSSYAYNRLTNESSLCYFALNLEEGCYIFLFKNSPDHYLVVSQDGNMSKEQLLEHFADFIAAYSPEIWK